MGLKLGGKLILLTGGARSGKSSYAQQLAAGMDGEVLFVATAEAGDEEMRRRIENHKKSRPASWRTLEVTTDIGSHISRELGSAGVVIVDCVTLLVNNIFNRDAGKAAADLIRKGVAAEIDGLIECMRGSDTTFIIVTNELGMGLVPAEATSRLYRDLLGRANQRLAAAANEVYLMVSGIPARIKPA